MIKELETARDYAINIGGRTIGWTGYLREFYSESISHPVIDQSYPVAIRRAQSQAVLTGLSVGLVTQIATPIVYELNRRFSALDTVPLILMGGVTIDLLSTLPAVIFLGHGHPAEAILAKLAANAVTCVSLDLLGAAARRVRTLKPPATTLAV